VKGTLSVSAAILALCLGNADVAAQTTTGSRESATQSDVADGSLSVPGQSQSTSRGDADGGCTQIGSNTFSCWTCVEDDAATGTETLCDWWTEIDGEEYP